MFKYKKLKYNVHMLFRKRRIMEKYLKNLLSLVALFNFKSCAYAFL